MKRPKVLGSLHAEHHITTEKNYISWVEYADYLEVKSGLLDKLVEQLTIENEDLKAAANARDYETNTLITSLKDELNKFPPPIGDCDEEV